MCNITHVRATNLLIKHLRRNGRMSERKPIEEDFSESIPSVG